MEKLESFPPEQSEKACNSSLNAIGDSLYAIGGKWKLRLIVVLLHGNRRFNDLQRTIKGISSKVLASELKDLELNGFVKRNVLTESPLVIEYELTEYALTLRKVLEALNEWGTAHREKIRQGMKEEFEASR